MPWLQQWLSHLHNSAAAAETTDAPFGAGISSPPRVGRVTDHFQLLRSAAGRKHLGSFLEHSSKSSVHHGTDIVSSSLPLHKISSSSRALGNSFLDVTLSGKQDGMSVLTTSMADGQVRLHRQDPTAFAEKAGDDVDPLKPFGTLWLNIYRVCFVSGLGISIAGSVALDASVELRSLLKLDQDKQAASERVFSKEEPGAVEARETHSCRAVIEEQARDEDGIRIIGDKVVRYDVMMMLRPLRRLKHTILDEKAVWQALCQVMIYFFAIGLITLESVHSGKSVLLYLFQDILVGNGAVARMGDFVKSLTGFTSFFLGLFTTLTLSRHAKIWDDGILRIFRGTQKLCVMLSSDLPATWMETDDPTQPPREVRREAVVSTFNRWSQASIIILFWRYGRKHSIESTLATTHRKGLLTDEELELLQQVDDNHALTIWAWCFKLINKSLKDGLASIPMQPYHIVHNEAMWGVTRVEEEILQPLPFSYISMISMFVKFLNISVTCSGGILTARALLYRNEAEALFDLGATILIPLITNSVVVLNLNLANPLQDHFTGMSPDDIVFRLDRACQAAQAGSVSIPRVITTKWEKQIQSEAY